MGSYTDTTVQPGVTYAYDIDARNAQGASPATPPKSVTIPGGTRFSVLNYGADPTGVQLSTAAFLEAMKLATAAKGICYAPTGKYRIDASGSAGSGACLQVQGPNLTMLGDGSGKTSLVLDKVGLDGSGKRPGIIGSPQNDYLTVTGMTLDTRTNNNTFPFISKDPDPSCLHTTGSHCRFDDLVARAGTGFCVRLTGSSPCESFPTGDNVFQNSTCDSESYGGGFCALDIDCQGHFGPALWTYVTNVVCIGFLSMFYDSYVHVDGFTFTPSVNQPACAPCSIISTTTKGPSHDIPYANVKSNGGPIKVEYKPSGPFPFPGLVLPTGMYWNPAC